MDAKGGGHQAWRQWAIDLAGALLLGGLIGLALWFHARDSAVITPRSTLSASGDLGVIFTVPGAAGPAAAAPEMALVEAVAGATRSIDMAVYELDLAPLADALAAAADRGVRVRIVAESDEANTGQLPRLEALGIPVVLDRRPSLMHDKFTVIDGLDVWTGSMNYTTNGVHRNNNNVIHLRSAEAAGLFTQEFEEMFVDDRFSALSLADAIPRTLDLGDAMVEILFSPDDHPADRIVEAIETATSSIDVLAFSFTSDDIAGALLARQRAGAHVRVVLEADQAAGAGSQYDALQAAGVDVRLDGNEGLLHHKVIVVDGSTVITGSYNFSRSAETTNDENVLIIHSRTVAQAFEAEVDRLYEAGLP
jgi:phosphatidylserine/phosphatidylglycerophosphate/cardiolipin synthase-like enzyme